MRHSRAPERPALEDAIRRAAEWFDNLTPAQQAEHRRAQARSWTRGEAGMGSDADEAKYAAALHSGDRDRIAACEAEARRRVERVDQILREGGAL